jgi:hypothetical protein
MTKRGSVSAMMDTKKGKSVVASEDVMTIITGTLKKEPWTLERGKETQTDQAKKKKKERKKKNTKMGFFNSIQLMYQFQTKKARNEAKERRKNDNSKSTSCFFVVDSSGTLAFKLEQIVPWARVMRWWAWQVAQSSYGPAYAALCYRAY